MKLIHFLAMWAAIAVIVFVVIAVSAMCIGTTIVAMFASIWIAEMAVLSGCFFHGGFIIIGWLEEKHKEFQLLQERVVHLEEVAGIALIAKLESEHK